MKLLWRAKCMVSWDPHGPVGQSQSPIAYRLWIDPSAFLDTRLQLLMSHFKNIKTKRRSTTQ